MAGFGGLEVFVEFQHRVDEFDHAVVTGLIGRIGEVDGTDRELFDKLCPESNIPTPQSRSYVEQIPKKKLRVEQTQNVQGRFLNSIP